VSSAGTDPKDRWDKLQIFLQPVGGLLTAAAIAMFGFVTSSKLDERQQKDTRARLYTELMSKREESESSLRKDMFLSILNSFVEQKSSTIDGDVLKLELLAYNFHESLNLKPLFLSLKRRIATDLAASPSPAARADLEAGVDRLERVAREIARKQMIVLEGAGKKFDRTVDLTSDPEGTTLEPAILTIGTDSTTFALDILKVDRDNREIQVALNVETPDPEQGRQTKFVSFFVSYFDFPMIDNVRLNQNRRCAVVLNSFSEQSAELTVVFFPGAYASLKERPYYEEVIKDVLETDKSPKK